MAIVIDQNVPPEYSDLYATYLRFATEQGWVRLRCPWRINIRPGTVPAERWKIFQDAIECWKTLSIEQRQSWYEFARDNWPGEFYFNVFMRCYLLSEPENGQRPCPPLQCLPSTTEHGLFPTLGLGHALVGALDPETGDTFTALAQSFTPDRDVTIRKVYLCMCRYEGQDRPDLEISIRTQLDGEILSQTSIRLWSLKPCPAWILHQDKSCCVIAMPPVNVYAGTQYYLQLDAEARDYTTFGTYGVLTGFRHTGVTCPPDGCWYGDYYEKINDAWEWHNLYLHYSVNHPPTPISECGAPLEIGRSRVGGPDFIGGYAEE